MSLAAAPAAASAVSLAKASAAADAAGFMDQRGTIFSQRGADHDKARKGKKKKVVKKKGSSTPTATSAATAASSAADGGAPAVETLQEQIHQRELELAELRATLLDEEARTDKMQQVAELALRALDAQLADNKWSTVVTPPDGSLPGSTFQWMDATKGINTTAVTVPTDWTGGPVLIRLHGTPVAPRLPAPALGAPPPSRPLRNPFQELAAPLAGVADTRLSLIHI